MSDKKKCLHEFHWYPATNEDGWRCCHCEHRPGEPPGFSPQLDREMLDIKIGGMLMELHEAKIVYVSNGDMGDGLTAHVARLCRGFGLYDQYTIARLILEALDVSHAKYWAGISNGIMAGKDPRERCACGKLATVYGDKPRCSDHWTSPFEDVTP